MTWLLDASVLIALGSSDHTAHDRCHAWIGSDAVTRFATCPITQTALLRFVVRRQPQNGVEHAVAVLASICADARHEFWPDEVEPLRLAWDGVRGHRQVTDAYLASLARSRSGRLITLDQGLALLQSDVAELISAAT